MSDTGRVSYSSFWRLRLILLLSLLLSANLRAETISLAETDTTIGEYATGLIKLALSYSSNRYDYNEFSGDYAEARLFAEVESGNISVLWAATNEEKEKLLHPIRFPMFKGLLGHRIFIIPEGRQAYFDDIETFDDLKRITFGQGRTWPDTRILEHNGLYVEKVNRYNNLFHMVEGGRFDAFPRGVQEPWSEIASRPELHLTVEKNLMLIYKLPFYFFVRSSTDQFTIDLTEGLEKALNDGSFNTYFFSAPLIKDVLAKSNLKHRKYFNLENPILPKDTPLERKEYWLDPASI